MQPRLVMHSIDPDDAAITRTIVALTQNLGMTVVADGVESKVQLPSSQQLQRISGVSIQWAAADRPLRAFMAKHSTEVQLQEA